MNQDVSQDIKGQDMEMVQQNPKLLLRRTHRLHGLAIERHVRQGMAHDIPWSSQGRGPGSMWDLLFAVLDL